MKITTSIKIIVLSIEWAEIVKVNINILKKFCGFKNYLKKWNIKKIYIYKRIKDDNIECITLIEDKNTKSECNILIINIKLFI